MISILATAILSPRNLVWYDEFNGSGLADSSKWAYEFGYARNKELQDFTVAHGANAWPLKYSIDYVRVYQKVEKTS
jgi:hypothetical protein